MGFRWKRNGLRGISNLDPHIYSKEKLREISQERRERVNKFRAAKEAIRPSSVET
jgi:hypothetical protein